MHHQNNKSRAPRWLYDGFLGVQIGDKFCSERGWCLCLDRTIDACIETGFSWFLCHFSRVRGHVYRKPQRKPTGILSLCKTLLMVVLIFWNWLKYGMLRLYVQYEDKKTFDGTAQYARNKRVQVWSPPPKKKPNYPSVVAPHCKLEAWAPSCRLGLKDWIKAGGVEGTSNTWAWMMSNKLVLGTCYCRVWY